MLTRCTPSLQHHTTDARTLRTTSSFARSCRVETRRITPDPLRSLSLRNRSPAARAPLYGVLCPNPLTEALKTVAPRRGATLWRVGLCRTTASGVRVRIVLVVRRRTAPVCRVMVGLGFGPLALELLLSSDLYFLLVMPRAPGVLRRELRTSRVRFQ